MSIVLSTVASQQKISRTSDLDNKISQAEQAKISLQQTVNELVTAGSDLDPKSEAAKTLEARKQALLALEKKLDLQLNAYAKEKGQVTESLGIIEQLGAKQG